MPSREGIEYLLWRHELSDGEVTTLYAVLHPRRSTRARVVHFPRPERLDVWCRKTGVEEAIVGGSFSETPIDREGFSAGAGQFDSDITDGRYPRRRPRGLERVADRARV